MVPSPRGRGVALINRILTVGGLTLLSRVTGFVRDIVMAAVLGAGPVADAFLVAFRLPNHFRAIFAEGAFAAAFVPADSDMSVIRCPLVSRPRGAGLTRPKPAPCRRPRVASSCIGAAPWPRRHL